MDIGGYPVEKLNHAYQLTYSTNRIPSIVPLFPTFNITLEGPLEECGPYAKQIYSDYDSYKYKNGFFYYIKDLEGKVHKIDPELKHQETYVYSILLTDTITTTDTYHLYYKQSNDFTHRMNFFTAADISQYTCAIQINSDCYVEKINIDYDIPIEINSFDKDMSVSSTSFHIKDRFLNDKIVNKGGSAFHVKFPTLANLQLIRSLILTTLLTALVAIFFSNLFFLIRKYALLFKEKHSLQIDEKRVKSFKIKLYILLYIVLIFIGYVTWRLFKDAPFHIKYETYNFLIKYNWWILLGVFIILSVLIYFLFRKAYTKKKLNKNNERIRNQT